MENIYDSVMNEPQVLERACGGYLAISAPGAVLRIGADGRTEEEARQRFAELVRRWSVARNAERALLASSSGLK